MADSSFLKSSIRGLCPRCDAATMFDPENLARVRFSDKCSNCGLDYSSYNVGDGPAALLVIPITTLIIVLAIMLDIAVRPPFWVHLIIWVPVTTIVTFGSIRIIKAALLILEHRRGAKEVTNDDVESDKE